MRVKDKQRIERFVDMARAVSRSPSAIVRLPLCGCEAEVWAVDGRAIVKVATGGLIVLNWFSWMAYRRRHKLI